MSNFNKNKFLWHELFSNESGKTSASGFIGVILGIVGALSFICVMIGYWLQWPLTIEISGEILKLIGAIAVLLGVRKVSGNFSRNNNHNNQDDYSNYQENNYRDNNDYNYDSYNSQDRFPRYSELDSSTSDPL